MKKKLTWERVSIDFKRNYQKYLIILPIIVFYLLFDYKPMYGVVIAFKNYRPVLGIEGSKWVGFDHFIRFFNDVNCFRVIKNTLSINIAQLVFAFPMPIILALLLNEVKNAAFKKTVQTITYMPHFVATMILCGMLTSFCETNGLFNVIGSWFGAERTNLLMKSSAYYPIYIGSDIWKNIGWDSIIFLAALSGIDQEQYEAAKVDGAGRLKQMFYITLPGLIPTVAILLILRMGGLMSEGYEKTLLLYQPITYEVSDIVSTYVYRKGLIDGNYSYSTAIGLFNSVVNLILMRTANWFSKKAGQSGLF